MNIFKEQKRLKFGTRIKSHADRPGKIIDDYLPSSRQACDKYGRYLVKWDDCEKYDVLNDSNFVVEENQ